MTRARRRDDDDNYEDRDPEEPDDFDRDDSDPFGTDTEPCPHCKREVHELTDICPHCGNFILRDEGPAATSKIWLITSVILLLLILGLILFSGRF